MKVDVEFAVVHSAKLFNQRSKKKTLGNKAQQYF
jgi:hypothetical protein